MIPLARQKKFSLYQLNEGAVTVEFGTTISDEINSKVAALDELLSQEPVPGMYQTVPAYASLTIYFDPLILLGSTLPGLTSAEKAGAYLDTLSEKLDESQKLAEGRFFTIPVCYGGQFGPDLEYVAGVHNLTTDDVIRLHIDAEYKVYMMGFIPGFSYMGGLNPLLETPRKPSPVRVAAGAVGIAGSQAGVYPLDTPGGWQIIGRTPVKMFDAERPEPSLLKAGDRVRFEPMTLTDFENYTRP